MEKSLIFCQSPAFLPVVLSCYEKEREAGRNVTIVVRNAKGMYDFLMSLNIFADIYFFENHVPNGVRPLCHFSKILKCIKKDIARYLGDRQFSHVFFTDMLDDFVQVLYLKCFKKTSLIHWILEDISEDGRERWFKQRKVPFKMHIKAFLYSICFRVYLFPAKSDHWTLAFDVKDFGNLQCRYNIKGVLLKYGYQLKTCDKKSAVFFTEPYRNHFQTEANYNEMNTKIVEALHQRGYYVAVKGHPRIGCNENALQLADELIPNFVPAEFLSLEKFNLAIGFVSTSICNSAKIIPSYSVLRMCNITNETEANYWKDYLNSVSNNKVIFINSFNDLD